MKNVCIIFLLSIIISLSALGFAGRVNEGGMSGSNGQSTARCEDFLRLHVRADSNEAEAQAVKYKVRDRVVEYLTPLVASYQSKVEALAGLRKNLGKITALVNLVLQEEGFSYTGEAVLTEEVFPTRVYEEYTLPYGVYTSLIIRLGRGEGDNWWCVVYPPLCFVATDSNVVYKSKIKEIIEKWQGQVFNERKKEEDTY